MWLFIPLLFLLILVLVIILILPGAMTAPRAWLIFITSTAALLISYLIFKRSRSESDKHMAANNNQASPKEIKFLKLALGFSSLAFAVYELTLIILFNENPASKTSALFMSLMGQYGSVIFWLLCSAILLRSK
jgi:hypothetical protein